MYPSDLAESFRRSRSSNAAFSVNVVIRIFDGVALRVEEDIMLEGLGLGSSQGQDRLLFAAVFQLIVLREPVVDLVKDNNFQSFLSLPLPR